MAKKRKKETTKRTLKTKFFQGIRWVITRFLVVSILSVIIFRFVPIFITPTMCFQKYEAYFLNKNTTLHYQWTPLEKISVEAPICAIAAEDQHFFEHFGFDFSAMSEAFQSNLRNKQMKGGSTITQQVAKNLFLWQSRSYFRKIIEAYFTVLIEIFWTKRRIIEVYLNIAETGYLTFGFEQGSKRYFYHSSKTLSRQEAALLASILPNPKKFSPRSSYIQRKANFLMYKINYWEDTRKVKNWY